jgi:ParB family chromosome partitioning protein
MDDQIQLIKMDMIDRPVKLARELIDPERVRELAESIREHGLLQPVILRPVNGRFETVAGDRRYLAHKLLNLKEIKAIIKDLDDRDTVVVRGIENLQRVDLTPSEEALLYLSLKQEGGLSLKDIAKRTGKSFNTVDRYLHFGRCPEECRKAVDRKEVSLAVLEELMKIDDTDAFNYHFKMAVENGIGQKVASLWVEDYFKTKSGNYYDGDGGVPSPNLEIEIKPSFLTCDVCLGPCEIKAIRSLMVCPECRKKVRHV